MDPTVSMTVWALQRRSIPPGLVVRALVFADLPTPRRCAAATTIQRTTRGRAARRRVAKSRRIRASVDAWDKPFDERTFRLWAMRGHAYAEAWR